MKDEAAYRIESDKPPVLSEKDVLIRKRLALSAIFVDQIKNCGHSIVLLRSFHGGDILILRVEQLMNRINQCLTGHIFLLQNHAESLVFK